jgi:hypothetical protein
MSVGSKNAERLAALEAVFLAELTVELERVMSGAHTLFFFTEEFNPHHLASHQLPAVSAKLSALAIEILALRRRLRLSTRDVPAELFRTCLERSADLNDAHRLGPQRLAAELLARLQSG